MKSFFCILALSLILRPLAAQTPETTPTPNETETAASPTPAPDQAAASPSPTPGEEKDEAVPEKMGDSRLAPDAKYSSKVQDPSQIKADGSALVETADKAESKGPIPRVEMIVDSSGSMGQVLAKDKTRMYFMKKMLTRYLTDQYKQKAETGLRVYGSRRKGDCSDNELMIPFDVRSLGVIENKVSQLEPVGKTPLYKAVKAAAMDLKSYKGPRAIVVFTDGEDTCGGDPCKEGKFATDDPLLSTNIFIVAIGYKPKADDLKKFSCMGDTNTADDEDDLFNALGDINKKVLKEQINLIVNSPDPTAVVQLFRLENGAWKLDRNFTAAFGAIVPPGQYQAVVMLDPPYKFENVTIPPKKVVTLTVRGAGHVTVDFLEHILDVQMLDKHMNPVATFKSDMAGSVPTGRWTMKISKQPFYEKIVQKYDVAPNGDYHYKMRGVGAVKVVSRDLVGLYVYDNKKQILGNYLTNVPFALPIGQYKIHVNARCTFDLVEIKDDGKLNVLTCK